MLKNRIIKVLKSHGNEDNYHLVGQDVVFHSHYSMRDGSKGIDYITISSMKQLYLELGY